VADERQATVPRTAHFLHRGDPLTGRAPHAPSARASATRMLGQGCCGSRDTPSPWPTPSATLSKRAGSAQSPPTSARLM